MHLLQQEIAEARYDCDPHSGAERTEASGSKLINEEGLPIIDVTEPVTGDEASQGSQTPVVLEEPDLIPLKSLPPSDLERLRVERDRMLDLLEQEEMTEESRHRELESEQANIDLQKRKDDAKAEIERLKAAREMQKKMGKALLRNIADAREKEDRARMETEQNDQLASSQKSVKPKKSVSFADISSDEDEIPRDRTKMRAREVQLDWGDVAAARLRPTTGNPLMTKAQMESQPMKRQVVERTPSAYQQVDERVPDAADSDDESTPESPLGTESDEGDTLHSEQDSDSLNGENEDEEDEEFDLDSAQHHREIALEYLKKRNIIGRDAAKFIDPQLADNDHEWNQPVCIQLRLMLSSH